MKRFTVVMLAVAFMLTAVLAGSAFAADKIRIGTEGAYPPFNLVDDKGELQGFDIDIAKALCKEMGAECTFAAHDWDALIPGLVAKKYDCIIASMSITPERKQKVAFSKKYYASPAKFMAKKGSGYKVTKEGLKGKTIGVQRATIHENFLRDNFGDVADIKSYAKQEEANMDLEAGRVDLVIADAVVLQGGFLDTPAGKDFEFVGPGFMDEKWFGEGIGIAVRKEDQALADKFSAAIKALRENGEYKKINDKYFTFDLYGD